MTKLTVKQLYWICFMVMVVVYSLYNIYFVDVKNYYDISRKMRHVYKFISIILIYGIGTAGIRKYAVDWVVFIWHAIYVVAIAILLLFGLYSWFVGQLAVGVHNMVETLLQLLISPLFYIAVGIMVNRLASKAKSY